MFKPKITSDQFHVKSHSGADYIVCDSNEFEIAKFRVFKGAKENVSAFLAIPNLLDFYHATNRYLNNTDESKETDLLIAVGDARKNIEDSHGEKHPVQDIDEKELPY